MTQALTQTGNNSEVLSLLKDAGFDFDEEMAVTMPSGTVADLPRVRIDIRDNGNHKLYVDYGENYLDNGDSRELYLPGNKLEGIILESQMIRALWNEGDVTPSCSSINGHIRSDNPVAESCTHCVEAKIPEGNCKPKARLLLLAKLDGQIMPLLLNLPPTSIKHFDAHKRRLTRSNLPMIAVNTTLTVVPVKKNNYQWGEIMFGYGGFADKDMLLVAKDIRDELKRFTEGILQADFAEKGDKVAF